VGDDLYRRAPRVIYHFAKPVRGGAGEKKMKAIFFYDFPPCRIGLAETNGALSHLFFTAVYGKDDFMRQETLLIQRAAAQLAEYFNGKRQLFDLPLAPAGTEFQMAVWKALQTIPYGQTRSYGQIAAAIGRPQASRAVGGANHNNPIPILIPCHRVIGADGGLTGFGGGLPLKKFLLELEQTTSKV
jgi:methylated-DNA-[protein]-cysteine S-methyltransferase